MIERPLLLCTDLSSSTFSWCICKAIGHDTLTYTPLSPDNAGDRSVNSMRTVIVRENYTGSLHLTRAVVLVSLDTDPSPEGQAGTALHLQAGDRVLVLDIAPDPQFLDEKWCKVTKVGTADVGFYPIVYLQFEDNF